MLIPSSDAMPPPPPPPRRKGAPPELPPPQGDALRCPRCDSTNTKFCYYNNYSLSQPRHFCKSCRRYWTKGGSLRNIPIGGASRKTKKSSRSSSSSSSDLAGLKLFHGISPSMPDFPPNLSSPFGDLTLNPFNNGSTSIGLNFDNFPFSTGHDHGGSLVISSAGSDQAASSIESLSAHNLELHWKMQQQRMAMLYGGVGGSGGGGGVAEENNNDYNNHNNKGFDQGGEGFVGVGPVMTSAHVERPQPIFFQNLEVITSNTKQQPHPPPLHASSNAGNEGQAAVATEWFFDSSYGGGGVYNTSNGKNTESTNGMNDATSSLNNGSAAGGGGQGWGDDQFHQFNGLV